MRLQRFDGNVEGFVRQDAAIDEDRVLGIQPEIPVVPEILVQEFLAPRPGALASASKASISRTWTGGNAAGYDDVARAANASDGTLSLPKSLTSAPVWRCS